MKGLKIMPFKLTCLQSSAVGAGDAADAAPSPSKNLLGKID